MCISQHLKWMRRDNGSFGWYQTVNWNDVTNEVRFCLIAPCLFLNFSLFKCIRSMEIWQFWIKFFKQINLTHRQTDSTISIAQRPISNSFQIALIEYCYHRWKWPNKSAFRLGASSIQKQTLFDHWPVNLSSLLLLIGQLINYNYFNSQYFIAYSLYIS